MRTEKLTTRLKFVALYGYLSIKGVKMYPLEKPDNSILVRKITVTLAPGKQVIFNIGVRKEKYALYRLGRFFKTEHLQYTASIDNVLDSSAALALSEEVVLVVDLSITKYFGMELLARVLSHLLLDYYILLDQSQEYE